MRTAASKALAFSYSWANPGPDDEWSVAPRLSSPFVSLAASKHKVLTLDVYLEAGKATTGAIQIQPVIQSPEHGWWFQLNPVSVDAVKGKPAGRKV